MNKSIPHLIAGISLLSLAACGGGVSSNSSSSGGGGGTSGMEMPVTLSVVNPDTDYQGNSTAVPAAMSIGGQAVIAALNDPNTDYTVDPQRSWIHDDALDPLETVNNILCMVNQIRADQLVNQTYVALVDSSNCEREGDNNQGQNQSSSGGQSVELEKWIVESTRADNYSPQVVRLWIEDPDPGEELQQRIRAEITITEGVSTSNPYGQFELNFVALAKNDYTSPLGTWVFAGNPTMTGTLKTTRQANGDLGFTFYQQVPVWNMTSVATVVTDAAQSSGYAHTGSQFPEWDGSQFVGKQSYHAVAFDLNNVLIRSKLGSLAVLPDLPDDPLSYLDLSLTDGQGEAEGGICRSRTQFRRNIWRYDLYHAVDGSFNGQPVTAGERVRVNSGFPFRADADLDGTEEHGYVGYWGLWSQETPGGGSWDGVVIQKETYDSSAVPETFTVKESQGKMIRRNKATIPLNKLDGENFMYTECISACVEYKLEYTTDVILNDGTDVSALGGANLFYKVATVDWSVTPPETPMTPAKIDSAFTSTLYMWSHSLGGLVFHELTTTDITFYKETIINGTDSSLAGGALILDCYIDCIKGGLTETQYLDPHGADPAYYPNSATPGSPAAVYQLDPATMQLFVVEEAGGPITPKEVTAPACTNIDLCMEGSPWGIRSGAMVVAGTMLTTNTWETWNEPESFTWETGHNNYNKLTYLVDGSGNQVAFQPPISFSYTHLTANDSNADVLPGGVSPFDGKTYLMHYGGNGDFWGIPSEQINGDWKPLFAILDGTVMGPGGTEFVIKAREMELKPVLAPGACTTAGLMAGTPATPLPVTADGTPSNVREDPPVLVDETPKVIGGELVDADIFSAF